MDWLNWDWGLHKYRNTRSAACCVSVCVCQDKSASGLHTAVDPQVKKESHFLVAERLGMNWCAELAARVKLTMKVAHFRSKSIQPLLPCLFNGFSALEVARRLRRVLSQSHTSDQWHWDKGSSYVMERLQMDIFCTHQLQPCPNVEWPDG